MNKSTISFRNNQLKNYVISHDALRALKGGNGGGTSGEEEEETPPPPPWMQMSSPLATDLSGTTGGNG